MPEPASDGRGVDAPVARGSVALIGAGLIGQAWAIVFLRAGWPVRLFDADPDVLGRAPAAIADRFGELARAGLVPDPSAPLENLATASSLDEAVAGAVHIQESTAERVEVKREVFTALDQAAAPETVLASSTSGIPASAFTADLRGRGRCLVAHPINPPYLVPLVELCPAPWTGPEVVDRTYALMRAVGQAPIRMAHEVAGFVANRMQGALIGAALRLVRDGVAAPDDVDIAIRHGIGLRWSFMGPFETIDLNAPAGLADYLERYGPLYHSIEEEAGALDWSDPALIDTLTRARQERLPSDRLPERSRWRDRRLMALVAHKRQADEDFGE